MDQHFDFVIYLVNAWIVGLGNVLVDAGSSSSEGTTSECRLIVALAKEVCVDERGNKRVLEGNGTEENANEDDKLSICNEFHGSVIVSYYRFQRGTERSNKCITHP